MNRLSVALLTVLFVIGLGCFVAVAVFPVEAAGTWRWTYETCYTNDCIQDTLNKIGPQAASAAKLTSGKAPVTGWACTWVWYPQ